MDAELTKLLKSKDLPGRTLLRRVGDLFAHLREVGCERDSAGNRKLTFDEYCSWILLYAFVPALTSLRALQEASDIQELREALGLRRFSLGSFSEAAAVFDPQQLQPIAANLAVQLEARGVDPRLNEVNFAVHLVDSTLMRTLPRLFETLYHHGKDGSEYHAWRVHMDLQVGMPAPERFTVTGAHGSERGVLKRTARGGCCYVTDRGYQDVTVYNRIESLGSRYVCRVKENLKCRILQELPISEEDRAAGVLSDQIVKLRPSRGVEANHPVRLVTLSTEVHLKRRKRHPGEKIATSGELLLLTNLRAGEASAAVVGLLFRYRWEIETFFYYLKQVLGMKHLICHRRGSLQILLYCMVICCMLLQLWTGQRPDAATRRRLEWYLLGFATLEELQATIAHSNAKRERAQKPW